MLRPVTALMLAALATPALAGDAAKTEPKNEIVFFGGASILSADRSAEWAVPVPEWPRLFPGVPRPATTPQITLGAKSELGSSALLGFRYSRKIKDRLAAEADIAVGPTHDLAITGEACAGRGMCVGGREVMDMARGMWGGNAGQGPDFDFGRPERRLTAWHYGANLTFDLATGDIRPVLIAGAGGVTWSGSQQTETDLTLRFGAGLKVYFGTLGMRIDAVDYLIPDHFLTGKLENDVHVTAAVLVRF